MSSSSVISLPRTRRRFSREFKAEMVAQCLKPGASVSRISLDNGLNANMVRRWISQTRGTGSLPATTGFVPVNLPAPTSVPASRSAHNTGKTIRIEIPRSGGAVVVEWPAEQAHQCIALLRDLLG